MVDPTRGVLYPARLPTFHRLPPAAEARDLVSWYWIPEWDLGPEESSPQDVIGYPAANLVVEPQGVSLVGPTTRAARRELRGRGWAVGALLRPAATAALATDPAALVDSGRPLDAPDLHAAVCAAMASGHGHRERAAAATGTWLAARSGPPGEAARQANAMVDLLLGDATVRTPEQAAARLSVSVRTLQRMAHRFVGLPPAAIIRRRRLQEAAQAVRAGRAADLAALAAEYGYADHAHLANEFRAVLGLTPSEYRSVSGRSAGTPEEA
ncbi:MULTISPECIES: AraC family transcriptional regulator [Microbacterium]|uniref:AraC family transcriptional regulator n=1 Tax=Microbacterium TaxID=33882 RepID=UPI00300FD174